MQTIEHQRFDLSRHDGVIAKKAVTTKKASELLGISEAVFRQLENEGLIGTRDVEVHFYKYFALGAIEELLDLLENAGFESIPSVINEPSNRDLERFIPLISLLKTGFGPPFSKIIRFIIENKIVPDQVRHEEIGFRRFLYDEKKINSLYGSIWNNSTFLNRHNAAEFLGIKLPLLAVITKSGLIPTRRISDSAKSHPKSKWFDRAELKNFASTHANVADMADDIEMEPLKLLLLLRSINVLPVLDGGSPKSCYWNREKVKGIIDSMKVDETRSTDRRQKPASNATEPNSVRR